MPLKEIGRHEEKEVRRDRRTDLSAERDWRNRNGGRKKERRDRQIDK